METKTQEEKSLAYDKSVFNNLTKLGDWAMEFKDSFKYDSKGNFSNHIDNYNIYLSNHPAVKNQIRYNILSQSIYIYDRPIENVDYATLRYNIESDMGIYNASKVDDVIEIIAKEHSYNPAIEYFKTLQWDGIDRAETLFIDWLKAEDTPLNREITMKWLFGAYKRMLYPGCINENILITVGSQGCGKTKLVELLSSGFGFDTGISIDKEQEYGQKLDACWFAVFDELSSFNKKDIAAVKKFLSAREDRFRKPYDRVVEVHKRHCAYYGTSNDFNFLRDYTDMVERRFWIMEVHQTRDKWIEIMPDFNQEYIDLIWAEIAYKFHQDETMMIDIDPKYFTNLREEQRKFKTCNEDNVSELLEELLDRKYVLDKNGQFKDNSDMINQMKGNVSYPQGPDEQYGYINIIKSSAVKVIMKEILKETRMHKYFAYTLDGKWEVNVPSYFYKGAAAYKRIKPIFINSVPEIEDDGIIESFIK